MGQCPRCMSDELIFLFKENRHMPSGEFCYAWTYVECCDCALVFIESELQSSPKVKIDE